MRLYATIQIWKIRIPLGSGDDEDYENITFIFGRHEFWIAIFDSL